MLRLLFVDDEIRIQELVQAGLSTDGFEVTTCSSAEEAMELEATEAFDGYLLDLVLPGMDGVALCRWLRDQGHQEPIIMLTAKGSLDDKVTGLEAGADDYLAKPFELAELRARFRAMFRKIQGYPREPLSVDDLVLDPNSRRVTRGTIELTLSRKETLLLEYLLRNQTRLVTRAMIAHAVWDSDTSQYSNVIDVFINHLRRKVDLPGSRKLVHTIRGKGFQLTTNPEQGI